MSNLDRDTLHDYVVAHGLGVPTDEAYAWAEQHAAAEGAADYAGLAADVVALGLVDDRRYRIHSVAEAKSFEDDEDGGWWSNTLGWVDKDSADEFDAAERQAFSLPAIGSPDARWVEIEV